MWEQPISSYSQHFFSVLQRAFCYLQREPSTIRRILYYSFIYWGAAFTSSTIIAQKFIDLAFSRTTSVFVEEFCNIYWHTLVRHHHSHVGFHDPMRLLRFFLHAFASANLLLSHLGTSGFMHLCHTTSCLPKTKASSLSHAHVPRPRSLLSDPNRSRSSPIWMENPDDENESRLDVFDGIIQSYR